MLSHAGAVAGPESAGELCGLEPSCFPSTKEPMLTVCWAQPIVATSWGVGGTPEWWAEVKVEPCLLQGEPTCLRSSLHPWGLSPLLSLPDDSCVCSHHLVE